MPHKIGPAKQAYQLFGFLSLVAESVFAKPGWKANSRTVLLQEQRTAIIDRSAEREPAADKEPCRIYGDVLMAKLQCAFIGQFDRKRTDKGAGSKRQQSGKPSFWKAGIKAKHSAQHG